MSQLQIVCQNCGAKYRLPESFSNDRAKCKACGSVIDVAAQRDGGASAAAAAARPAGARPAAARPAAARPASGRPAGARPAAARKKDEDDAPRAGSTRRSGARASGGRAAGGGARRRRGEEEEPKGSNQNMLFIGIGAVVVILVAVFALGGDDPKETDKNGGDPKKNEVASSNKEDNSQSSQSNDTTNTNDTKPDEQSAGGGDAEPASGAGEKPTEKPAEKPSSGSSGSGKEPVTEDNLFDPRKQTSALEWPEGIEAATREETEGWVEDIEFAGLAGIRAKKGLRENPYPAIFAVVNKMRTLDLRDGDQTRYAAELSRMMQDDLTGGTNVPFTDVAPGEAVPLEIANKNGKCVKAWIDWANRASQDGNFLSSKDAFTKYLEEKAKKKAGQGK